MTEDLAEAEIQSLATPLSDLPDRLTQNLPVSLRPRPRFPVACSLRPGMVSYASQDGSLLWEFDTGREFEAVNGTAVGGQIGAHPIQILNRTVFVTSGASSRAKPGNTLLVFEVNEAND
jgi:hypothetical protein